MKLEKIGEVFKDSIIKTNDEMHFTADQIDILTESIKAAFEEYHRQED